MTTHYTIYRVNKLLALSFLLLNNKLTILRPALGPKSLPFSKSVLYFSRLQLQSFTPVFLLVLTSFVCRNQIKDTPDHSSSMLRLGFYFILCLKSSKIFKKLIHERIIESQSENQVYITGVEQHVFKKYKSIATTGLLL